MSNTLPPSVLPGSPRGAGGSEPPRSPRPRGKPKVQTEGTAESPVELQLSIGRDGIGIELARPFHLGCLTVGELALSLPGVRFPLDVSGGVARFRHRRGKLLRLGFEIPARVLEAWLRPRLRGVLGPRAPLVWVLVRRGGASVALADPDEESRRILAFEVTVDASRSAPAHGHVPHAGSEDALHLSITQARGSSLPRPATTLALDAMRDALGPIAVREGARFTIPRAAAMITRVLLPDAGVRAPSTDGIRFTVLGAQDDAWILHAADGGATAETTAEAARAHEACLVLRDADDALAKGDVDAARAAAVVALERAPRMREASRRIAEIDQLDGGRAEAALSSLVEAEREPDAHDGLLPGELLAAIGDMEAAIASFVRTGESEPMAPLAARAFERAAELAPDPHDALVWLDQAIARAPNVARIRWGRLARRLEAGRLEDALADAEHLEAQAHGGRARHAVWRRAGRAWQDAGLRAQAASIFERALRFDPDDPEAVAGLGVALVASGRPARGVALLTHAVELAEGRDLPRWGMVLELAQALATALLDRPAAVARLGSIPNDAKEAPLARGLEGRLRAELGDLPGASFAFARLRDLADARALPTAADDRPGHHLGDAAATVGWLLEAAAFEEERQGDRLAAQRHLACALRLSPHDPAVERAYRDVGQRILARATQEHERIPPVGPAMFQTEPPSGERVAFDLSLAPSSDAPPGMDEAEDALRVEDLTRKLHADPDDDAVVDELVVRLTRLGRGLDLLALLSARLEEAGPDRRAALVPKQKEVLARLEREARAAGRDVEAALFRDALSMLDT